MNRAPDDDDFVFLDEHDEVDPALPSSSPALKPIKLLIVDDEPAVHEVTRFALRNFRFNDQALEFISAYSSIEAATMLGLHPDVALILLDVVMETDDAGLRFARLVREELNNHIVRIILRTGQPGNAPEHKVIVDYDINDYKNKAELTADRLITAVHVAIRAYRQLLSIEMSRAGLEKIVSASSSLFEQRSMNEFVQGVVLQIQSFVEYADGAMLCALSQPSIDEGINRLRVIAGTGHFAATLGRWVDSVVDGSVLPLIEKALHEKQSIFTDEGSVIVFETYSRCASLVYLRGRLPLESIDRQLLEVFCSKIAVGFDNVYFFEQLTYSSTHDVLTGLLNRTAFLERVDAKIKLQKIQCDQEIDGLGIVVIGLDRFKDVNDDLGYDTGDRILKIIAERLSASLCMEDVACRLVGDTFGLMLGTLETPKALADHCEWLRLALSQPVQINGTEVIPTLSIGHIFIDGIEDPAYVALADAERAMDSAKRFGGFRCEMSTPRDQFPSEGRVAMVRDLTYALERNEFLLNYQPIVRSDNRQLAGFEALIRWNHPERGLVPPQKFIEIAESTSLMVPIGTWVLREALNQSDIWNGYAGGDSALRLAINVSARQLMTHELLEELTSWLETTPVPPGLLKLEVTESLLMEDIDLAEKVLTKIHSLGVKLSLDDFGTGFSSLSYLHRFPFDSLKLDQIFVRSMFERPQTLPILKSVIALAKALNIETIAEGVETETQASALKEMGCDYFQGYLFSKPLSAEGASIWVRNFYQQYADH